MIGRANSQLIRKTVRRNSTVTCSMSLGGPSISLWNSNEEDSSPHGRYAAVAPIQVGNQQHLKQYHTTSRNENSMLVLGLGAVALTAKAGQYGLQAYQEYQKNLPTQQQQEEQEGVNQEETTRKAQDNNTKTNTNDKSENKSDTKRKNIFQEWFGVGVGSKYYEGGFEETMTRREAALILGVRESSTSKRIKDAHRKILILNHPDTGGSTYIASKINEAKELLLKGKED